MGLSTLDGTCTDALTRSRVGHYARDMSLRSVAQDRRGGRAAITRSSALRAVNGRRPHTAVLTAVTVAVMERWSTGSPQAPTGPEPIGFVFGVLVAVMMVRHGSLFTAAVQPPLVFISAVPGVFAVGSSKLISIVLIQITDALTNTGNRHRVGVGRRAAPAEDPADPPGRSLTG